MITIKDVSEKCGVSQATVSKALNGYSDIGEKTAAHIREVAKQMGYLPNATARTLKTNRSHNLGVLFVDQTQSGLTHEYFSSMLESFKVEAERLGYDITFISRDIGHNGMSYYEHCRYRNFDGAMIACVDFQDAAVKELAASSIPTVTIDYVFDSRAAILSDNVQGVNELVTYLIERGHRDIAFIHGEDTSVTQKRLASFFRTCASFDIEVHPEYLRPALYHDPDSSARATRELLDMRRRPTAILYPDDFSFIGGMREIERRGLSIPEDISVVGYDGIYLSQVLRPRLTTLRQDSGAIGREAAARLVDSIENPRSFIPSQVMVKGHILEGESVKRLNG